MTDRYITESKFDLSQFCLSKRRTGRRLQKCYVKYREAFSLKNVMCCNTEVNLNVIDQSPVFIRPIHVKEENKPMIDKEIQRLVHLGILKKEHVTIFFSHSVVC